MPNVIKVERQSQVSFSDNKGLERTATVYFVVVFDSLATEVQAEQATGIPTYGAPHPDDPTRLMIHKRSQCVDPDDTRFNVWQVQCDYSNVAAVVANPLQQPGTTAWSVSPGSEPYFYDYSQPPKQVTNTAGDPYETLAQRQKTATTAVFTKNVSTSFALQTIIDAQDKVNSGPFLLDGYTIVTGAGLMSGGGLGVVQVVQISGGDTFEQVSYRVMTINLKFDRSRNGFNPWNDVFVSRGYNELVEFNGFNVLSPIVSGKPPVQIKKPWPLDEDGAAMPNATDAGANTAFVPYQSTNFSVFGFN